MFQPAGLWDREAAQLSDQWDSYHHSAGGREGEPQWRENQTHTNYHHIAWSLLIKPKNKTSAFFPLFCPKSIFIFNTTAFCNRWTITHRQSKPGNIKTFSTFVVWCHFWRQCLGEMHFFTFTPYLSIRGHLDITILWQTERRSHGGSHIRKMRQMHCQDTSQLDTFPVLLSS